MTTASSLPTPQSVTAAPASATASIGPRSWLERQAGVPGRRFVFGVAGLAAAYYGSARLGFDLGFSGPVAAIVWLPVGVGIAGLALGGLAYWPGVLLGDLLANNYSELPVGSALGQTIGNMIEVLVGAFLIRRIMRSGSPVASLRGVSGVFFAIATATMLSATIGSLSSLFGGVLTSAALPAVWRTWWLGDACGALVVVPLVIAWYASRDGDWSRRRWLEAGLMLATVAGVGELALMTDNPVAYLVFPPLLWAALRFGQRGASVAILIASGVVVWNTSHHAGAFHFHSITRSILNAQLFIIVATVSTLCLAAVVWERERFAEQLGASRARLLDAAEVERRRLEQNLHDGAQQRLIALALHLRFAASYRPQTAEQTAKLRAAEEDLRIAIDELREIAHGTHPAQLTSLGLADAIESVAKRSAIPVTFVELPSRRLDDETEAIAYYVFTETLANAQKYSHATSIRVRAVVTSSALRFEIHDDGIGGATEATGSGLAGLRDRVEANGGSFSLRSTPAVGTRIAAVLPLPPG
jgi:signal transduction histidine kinase